MRFHPRLVRNALTLAALAFTPSLATPQSSTSCSYGTADVPTAGNGTTTLQTTTMTSGSVTTTNYKDDAGNLVRTDNEDVFGNFTHMDFYPTPGMSISSPSDLYEKGHHYLDAGSTNDTSKPIPTHDSVGQSTDSDGMATKQNAVTCLKTC